MNEKLLKGYMHLVYRLNRCGNQLYRFNRTTNMKIYWKRCWQTGHIGNEIEEKSKKKKEKEPTTNALWISIDSFSKSHFCKKYHWATCDIWMWLKLGSLIQCDTIKLSSYPFHALLHQFIRILQKLLEWDVKRCIRYTGQSLSS